MLLLAPIDAAAEGTFRPLYDVFAHPRCTNCHADGEGPLRRDGRPHLPPVQRGPDGAGSGATACASCHRDSATPVMPGAPNWKMPSPDRPMIFRGRSAAALCRQITDPAQNGGRDAEALGRHLVEDPLVAWAWNAGTGRPPPPLDRDAFIAAAVTWVRAGAPCPPE